MGQPDPNHRPGWLARGGVTLVAFSFLLFILGLWPELFGMDLTPEIGVLQIFVFLLGLTGMTAGAYIYFYATRHRALPRKLREDIGVRLMATGLVIAATNGLANIIGIGSNFGEQRPLFGPVQAWGVSLGVVVIVVGVALYSQRPK